MLPRFTGSPEASARLENEPLRNDDVWFLFLLLTSLRAPSHDHAHRHVSTIGSKWLAPLMIGSDPPLAGEAPQPPVGLWPTSDRPSHPLTRQAKATLKFQPILTPFRQRLAIKLIVNCSRNTHACHMYKYI